MSRKIRFYNQKQRIYREETLLQAQSSPITFQYDAKQKNISKMWRAPRAHGHRVREEEETERNFTDSIFGPAILSH